jgi:hypothetical protein
MVSARPKWVHAEILMATYLLSQSELDSLVGYLGISKKTCFCGGRILQNLKRFSTHGNHGKIHAQWTLSRSCNLSPRYAEQIRVKVSALRVALLPNVKAVGSRPHQAIEECSITSLAPPQPVMSTIFNEHVADARNRARKAAWLRHS